MIIKFKIFENIEKQTSFIINDLVPYFEENTELVLIPWIDDDISTFLTKLLLNRYVKIECEKCEDIEHNYYKYFNKSHKGKVRGISFGFDHSTDKIYLTLELNRIRHKHIVNIYKPIIVYGDIPNDLDEIIDGTNLLSNTKKYNL